MHHECSRYIPTSSCMAIVIIIPIEENGSILRNENNKTTNTEETKENPCGFIWTCGLYLHATFYEGVL